MTGLLTSQELTRMRDRITAMLPDSCTIQTSSTAADGMGGKPENWANTYTSVACKLAAIIIKNASTEGNQFKVHAGWVLTLKFDQAIASGDRVVLGGDTYEVLSVEDDQSFRIARRAYLRRLD